MTTLDRIARTSCVTLIAFATVLMTGCKEEEAPPMHELNGYQSRFFELKRLEIPDRRIGGSDVFYVPSHWTHGLTEADNNWIGEPNDDYRLQLFFTQLRVETSIDAALRRAVSDLLEDFRQRRVLAAPKVTRRGDSTVLDATTEFVVHEDSRHVHSLFRIFVDNDRPVLGQMHFFFRPELADRPETADLFQLFRSQLFGLALAPHRPVADRLPKRSTDRYGFRNLKAVEPHGFMLVGVPSAWQEDRDGDVVGYYDPTQNSGELWFGYHVVVRDKHDRLEVSRKVERVWRETKDLEVDQLQWRVWDSTSDRSLIVIVNLMLKKGQADQPDFQDLILMLDEQVRRMKIGLPPADKEATLEMGKRSKGAASSR